MSGTIWKKRNKLTENEICNSFLNLLKEKPLNQITVADVCRKADINRGTFYLHYRDINDVIDYINSWYTDQIVQLIENTNGKHDWKSSFLEISSILLSWPEYSIVILGQEKGEQVIEKVTELSISAYIQNLKSIDPSMNDQDAEYRAVTLLHGSWAILRKWCSDGMTLSPSELVKYLDIFNFND